MESREVRQSLMNFPPAKTTSMNPITCRLLLTLSICVLLSCEEKSSNNKPGRKTLYEVNASEIGRGDGLYALVGATLIDGTGAHPVQNACVIVRDDKIEAVGKRDEVAIPEGAEVVDLTNMTLLPGLIDAHYHDEKSDTLTTLFLMNGVTSVRDPGEWIETYSKLRTSGKALPRLFLSGPHLDSHPPAYPEDARIVRDPTEAALAVDDAVNKGSSVIKVYFGLSLGLIQEVCERAKMHGVPVTAHLEVTDAMQAIDAGLDGIEHITSFGICLIDPRDAEVYKQSVLADKNARRKGRYEMWSRFSFESNPKVDTLIQFLVDRKTFVSPTLAIFERRLDRGDSVDVAGFANMMKFVGLAKERGARVVVGSHSYVPYADLGFAYQREMELLHASGLSNMEVIVAATSENARFFRIEDRLGSVEAGKLADLIVVEGDPLSDISVMRNVKRVMVNGAWRK